ncbi:MAG: hypothetical protein HY551_06790 [Elusimicrobia bacterium]|nr:hypothetical protein [Elusimicrobiota bacterium]
MPGYYKKRKGPQGPNKNEQKVIRARKAEFEARSTSVLGSKFPSVKHLRIHLTFLDHQRVLNEQSLSITPSEAAVFSVSCPGRCGQGAFDFTKKITETVDASLPLSESSAKCMEPFYADSPDTCGCEIKCRMEIEYFPVAATPPSVSPEGEAK